MLEISCHSSLILFTTVKKFSLQIFSFPTITLMRQSQQLLSAFSSAEMFNMANSVDPDQTAPIGAVCTGSTLFASILNSSVMLGNYLQQTNSADDIFRCVFFLGALRVNLIIHFHVFRMNCFYSIQEQKGVKGSLGNPMVTLWAFLLTFSIYKVHTGKFV